MHIISEGPRTLPEFEGYTVDFRLRQFRRVDREKLKMEFIDFNSKKGKQLLLKHEKSINSNS